MKQNLWDGIKWYQMDECLRAGSTTSPLSSEIDAMFVRFHRMVRLLLPCPSACFPWQPQQGGYGHGL